MTRGASNLVRQISSRYVAGHCCLASIHSTLPAPPPNSPVLGVAYRAALQPSAIVQPLD